MFYISLGYEGIGTPKDQFLKMKIGIISEVSYLHYFCLTWTLVGYSAAAAMAVMPPSDQPTAENRSKPKVFIRSTANLASRSKKLGSGKVRAGGLESPYPGGSQAMTVSSFWRDWGQSVLKQCDCCNTYLGVDALNRWGKVGLGRAQGTW